MDGTDPPKRRTPAPTWASTAIGTALVLSRTLATYAILQGTVTALAGPERWQHSPALQTALTLPGQTLTWGVWLALAGVLALIGSVQRRMLLTCTGHALAGVWSAFFAVTQAAELASGAPTTGVLVYGCEAVLFVVLAVGSWRLR